MSELLTDAQLDQVLRHHTALQGFSDDARLLQQICEQARLANRAAAVVEWPEEPSEVMLDKGEYVASEWLNDNAPIGQRMYREPAKAVYKAMRAAHLSAEKEK